MRANRQSRSTGFTLVEMLVVIVIIAVLAGLLLPAVNAARSSAHRAQIAIEINNLASAVEAYKLKYGDYPPDFSNRAVVHRHILTAWPNIDSNELNDFESYCYPADGIPRVDPAEALVFWLGGFSSDPKRPFTGTGGPLVPVLVRPGGYSINPDRLNGLCEFDQGRLTQLVLPDGRLMSIDEEEFYPPLFLRRDPFPVYQLKKHKSPSPFVYFDCRTYAGNAVLGILPPEFPLRYWQTNPSVINTVQGVATAYRTDRPRTGTLEDPVLFEWANKSSFQIVTAGLDDHFGSGLTTRRCPSGFDYDQSPLLGDDDNITNFSEGSRLKDMKP